MKKIITYFISFILFIFLLLATYTFMFSHTILNKDYLLNQLEKNNYYENVQKNIQTSFENYIQQSGLDENVIKDIYTLDDVKNDTKIIIANIYTNEKKEIDIEKVKTNLRKKIYDSLSDVRLLADEKKSIEEFVDIIADTYKNEIEHSSMLNIFDGKIFNINQKISKYNIMIYFVLTTLLIIIFALNIKELYNGFNSIGISIISFGMFQLVLRFFINNKIDIKNVLVLNEAVSLVIISIINEILKNSVIISIVSLIIGTLLCYISNFFKKIVK